MKALTKIGEFFTESYKHIFKLFAGLAMLVIIVIFIGILMAYPKVLFITLFVLFIATFAGCIYGMGKANRWW